MSDLFESERLAMRPLSVGDAAPLHEAYRDAELMRFWSSPPHASLDETVAYLSPRPEGSEWRGWAVTIKGDDAAIGTLAAGRRRAGVYEIGYLLARRHWGQGYAREAVARLLDLLFGDERARRVFADTDPDNAASNRLIERLGFELEGRLRGEWETHIGVRDSLIWGMLRDEWLDPRTARSRRT